MQSSFLTLFFLISILCTGCASPYHVDYRYFKSIGYSHNLSNLKTTGIVKSEDCNWTFLGYPIGARPSLEDAIENSVSLKSSEFTSTLSDEFRTKSYLLNTKVKMLVNINARTEGWSFILLGKSCVKISAIAYR